MMVDITLTPESIYSSVLSELRKEKKEVSDVVENVYLDYLLPDVAPSVIGYVPDIGIRGNIDRWCRYFYSGYEKPASPPMFLNPVAPYMLDVYDLKAAVYHEAVHQKQMLAELTMDRNPLEEVIERYVEFENEKEKEMFYRVRDALCRTPELRHVILEGEAQYLMSRAFPYASKSIKPYWKEEVIYRSMLEMVRGAVRKGGSPKDVKKYVAFLTYLFKPRTLYRHAS